LGQRDEGLGRWWSCELVGELLVKHGRGAEEPTCFALTIRALVFPAYPGQTEEEIYRDAKEAIDGFFSDKDDLEIVVIPDTDDHFPHAEPYDRHAMKITEGSPKKSLESKQVDRGARERSDGSFGGATQVAQADKAEKRVRAGGSAAWNRDRMNETHRKGMRSSKKVVRRARRRLDKVVSKGGS
jgi:hypothetical protein